MLQQLFRIPGLDMPVYGYGVMLVVGFFLALQLAQFLSRRSGLNPEHFVNAGLIALVSGVVGARLSHVIENFADFTRADLSVWQNVLNAINIRSGGLTYYGGFLLATPLTILYGIRKKIPLRLGMDIIAPCLMIGLGFGRIGCFLNGCCYGAECQLPPPLGVQFPYYSNAYVDQYEKGVLPHPPPAQLQEPLADGDGYALKSPAAVARDPNLAKLAADEHSATVHNAQIYSAFTALLLAGLLTAYFTLPHLPGRVFALMLMLEGGTRFLLEMLRSEPTRFGPLTLSMTIGLAILAAGILMWTIVGRFGRPDAPGFPLSAADQPA